ncbi:MAG TPA: class I SAM-dependent methyltransferase [Thermoanaerobaculia bacterium]|nr:class I SAM-dependent methyltransferase [Thermoanaerobaculia bacterium]
MTVDVSHAELIQGWMTRAELTWLARAAATRPRIVEIGAWKGRSTRVLARHTPGVVYVVDHWRGSRSDATEIQEEVASKGADGLFAEFQGNLAPEIAAGRVIPIRAESGDAVHSLRGLLEGGAVDMVFIDGDHSYESVSRDIRAYRPLLRRGGLLAGHDCSLAWPGVIRAVEELVPGSATMDGGSIWYSRIPVAESP